MIPELESRRNAWLEFFKTADDLGTDIFLSFKKSKAVFKHSGGAGLLTIIGSEPESLDFLFLEVVAFNLSSSSSVSVNKFFFSLAASISTMLLGRNPTAVFGFC